MSRTNANTIRQRMPRKTDPVAEAVMACKREQSRAISRLQTQKAALKRELAEARQRIAELESRGLPTADVETDTGFQVCAVCQTRLQPPDPKTHQRWCGVCEEFAEVKETK